MVMSSPAEMDMVVRLRVKRAVPDVIKKVSDWEGWRWNAGIIIELSFGFGPGRQGGSVNPIDVFLLVKLGSVLKETLERPPSMSKVVRWEIFVRTLGGDLRKENIVCEKKVLDGR